MHKKPARTHNVYVVELDKKVLKNAKFAKANPNHKWWKPCVYVGMTGLTPEERFENHKKGYRASKWVRDYGKRLKPRLYKRYNPMTRSEAEKMEKELARRLRKRGYAVRQN